MSDNERKVKISKKPRVVKLRAERARPVSVQATGNFKLKNRHSTLNGESDSLSSVKRRLITSAASQPRDVRTAIWNEQGRNNLIKDHLSLPLELVVAENTEPLITIEDSDLKRKPDPSIFNFAVHDRPLSIGSGIAPSHDQRHSTTIDVEKD